MLLALTDASVLVLTEENALVRRSDDLGLLIIRMPRQAIIEIRSKPHDSVVDLIFALARAGVSDEYPLTVSPNAAQDWSDIWNRS